MDHFEYRHGELFCDGVAATQLARDHGTPLYVYSEETIRHHFGVLRDAFAAAPPLICYSVKANSNLHILRLLAELGAGFDVVSGGELRRVIEAGGDPRKVVFAGVGKSEAEIAAAIDAGILLFNVEAESELTRIDACARAVGTEVGVAVRLNPDVDPQTHRYITTGRRQNKFGIDFARAERVLDNAAAMSGVVVRGLHIHLGSQITDTRPYVEGVRKVLDFLGGAPGASAVEWLDVGGGFGVHYEGGEALPAHAFAEALLPEIAGRPLRLILEPGRFIMGNAGVLLTRIVTLKESGDRRFAICDAGMNDLLRPSLYRSYHRIWPVVGEAPAPDAALEQPEAAAAGTTDIVGPICESGDFLGLRRELPALAEGELLAVFSAGAYGFTMASNYNTRGRPPELLVAGDRARLIRRRESYDDMLRTEREVQ